MIDATTSDGPIEFRVFGPPGTGKTTYLAGQVDRLSDRTVMVASFTKAAARVIAGRTQLPHDAVGTLHAFAYRSLGHPDIAEGSDKIDDFNKAHPAFRLSGGKKPNIEEADVEAFAVTDGDSLMLEYQRQRAIMSDRRLWNPALTTFADAWETWKSDTGLIDFTDMIEFAYHDTSVAPGSPEVGFFDEVQDFTRLELALVRKWGERMSYIVLAGDDDQCIYGFKGATPDAFLHPPVPEQHSRVLAQSYRLPVAIHSLTHRLISLVSERAPKKYAPKNEPGAVVVCPDTLATPERLVDMAAREAADGRTVMLLVACSYMLNPLINVLRKQGIPFHNPYRRTRGDWNPLRAPGITASQRFLAYMKLHRYEWDDRHKGGMWTNGDVALWSPAIEAKVFERGEKTRAGETDEFMTDIEVTADQIDRMFKLEHRGDLGTLEWFERHLLAARRKAFEFPMLIYRQRGGKALEATPRIIVGTIHSVKGGEADTVYLFPDLSGAGMREYLGPAELRDRAIRQFYVGATRAKDRLVLCGATGSWQFDLLHKLVAGGDA